mmetsp:Transcript_22836/g.33407  ORF Transcript_22836/g.33407 Transcript_22836/m.33407 type:complete len:267 (+) Transcript_22836:116-916(+)|eukprot:CAMPEP_0195517168 /NCGR_PEP_ID=MMETSP0794_2-20130614/10138_1 /TAXON_ID=515487 /ORGANISM="Stephanopyxis turris, Strain CCMP 815" /LENGTH=266 /DNA_ID=CAMNT_0040645933 /DNA_START=103 /DNA_END=903 /DNA_ORIENTATION=+
MFHRVASAATILLTLSSTDGFHHVTHKLWAKWAVPKVGYHSNKIGIKVGDARVKKLYVSAQSFVWENKETKTDDDVLINFSKPKSLAEANANPVKLSIVPINDSTTEFTAGLLGGALGLGVGGPVTGAIGAAAANYMSRKEFEDDKVVEVVKAMSLSAISSYNHFVKLDHEHGFWANIKGALEGASYLDKKSDQVGDVGMIESSIQGILKFLEDNDVVNVSASALEAVGDLIETMIDWLLSINEEFQLSEKTIKLVRRISGLAPRP